MCSRLRPDVVGSRDDSGSVLKSKMKATVEDFPQNINKPLPPAQHHVGFYKMIGLWDDDDYFAQSKKHPPDEQYIFNKTKSAINGNEFCLTFDQTESVLNEVLFIQVNFHHRVTSDQCPVFVQFIWNISIDYRLIFLSASFVCCQSLDLRINHYAFLLSPAATENRFIFRCIFITPKETW